MSYAHFNSRFTPVSSFWNLPRFQRQNMGRNTRETQVNWKSGLCGGLSSGFTADFTLYIAEG